MPSLTPFFACLLLVSFTSSFLATKADSYDEGTVSASINMSFSTTEENRIANGRLVFSSEITSVVFLGLRHKARSFNTCAGSLVSKYYVVTAAHCAIDKKLPKGQYPPIVVVLGRVFWNRDDRGQKVLVEDVKVHPDYNPRTSEYDVAILRLRDYELPRNEINYMQLGSRSEPYLDKTGKATIYGWGQYYENSPIPNQLLGADKMNVVDIMICKKRYNGLLRRLIFGNKVGDANLCVQAAEREDGLQKQQVCDGDSGGPLVRDGKMIGIVSWGGSGCDGESLEVFVKVSAVWDFINDEAKLGLDKRTGN